MDTVKEQSQHSFHDGKIVSSKTYGRKMMMLTELFKLAKKKETHGGTNSM